MGIFKNKEKKEEVIEEEQDFPTMSANVSINENNIEKIKEEVKEEVIKEKPKEEVIKEKPKEEIKELKYKKTFNEEEFLEYYNIVRNSENIKIFLQVTKGKEEYEKLMELEEIFNKYFNKEDK